MYNRRLARGFTLVELLVVMAIIGVLMSLLFPAIRFVMRRAQLINCQHNIHQLALACLSYAEEHQGWLPTQSGRTVPASADEASRALGLLYGRHGIVEKKVFQCPSEPAEETRITMSGGIADRFGTSYGYDATHRSGDPSDVAVLADSFDPGSPFYHHGDATAPRWVVGYLDGHTEVATTTAAGALDAGDRRDDIYTESTVSGIKGTRLDSVIKGGHKDDR